MPKRKKTSKVKSLIDDLFCAEPRMYRGYDLRESRRTVAALKPEEFDVVFAYRIDFGHFAGVLGHPRLMLDIDDPEHIRWQRRIAATNRSGGDWRTRRDIEKLRQFEHAAATRAKISIVCQEADQQGWPTMPIVVPNCVEIIHSPPEPSYFTQLGIPFRALEKPRPVVNSDIPESDVVIATWWETAEWVNDLSSNKGAKVYFIQHHEVFPYLPVERCHATYRLPLQKIVISRWLEKIMKLHYNDDKAILIPNSVDTTQFFAPKRNKQPDPVVGFVYSTAEFKGSDIVLAALQQIKEQIPNLRVLAFGAERISLELPLPSWVEYHYGPPQDQIRFLYSKCDVWLCGSRSEGFYLPMLDAMACRCPVVSARVGGRLTRSSMVSTVFSLI